MDQDQSMLLRVDCADFLLIFIGTTGKRERSRGDPAGALSGGA